MKEKEEIVLPSFLVGRDPNSHKGHFGHALLIAGSYGKMGAAVLAARSCLRSGVGLLTVHVPRCGVDILQTAVPEAMLSIDDNDACWSVLPDHLERYDAIAIGPGLGLHDCTYRVMEQLLMIMQRHDKRMVIDADGLNLLASHQGALMQFLPQMTILTPHAREFDRLYSRSVDPPSDLFSSWGIRFNACFALAKQLQCVVVHKAHRSLIVEPSGNYSNNTTGNAGMATAGSGDVLTGIILSLLSQVVAQGSHGVSEKSLPPPFQIARIAAFLHGKTAELAAQKQGECTLIASDLVENLRFIIR